MIRSLVAMFAFALAAVTLSAQPVKAEDKFPKDTCVKPCQDCAAECHHCMKHCLDNKNPEVAKQCEICHHICLACAAAVASKNGRAWQICELCEKECLDCALVCEKSDKSDEHMKKCAKACRDCAAACAAARK